MEAGSEALSAQPAAVLRGGRPCREGRGVDTVPAQCSGRWQLRLPHPAPPRALQEPEMQRRREIETLHSFKGTDPTPHCRLPAAVSGRGAQERLSLHVLHTVGTWSVCRGHARPAAGPGRGLLPSPQPLVAPLFQFLQVWNVSVCHQCQPDLENLQLREAGWGPPGNTGLSAGAGHPPRPSPLRNSLHC